MIKNQMNGIFVHVTNLHNSVKSYMDLIGLEVNLGEVKSPVFNNPVKLNQKIPNVSQKMLTQKLRHLEEYHFLKRQVCAVKPLHVEYELTEQGQSFLPILLTINDRGWNHLFKAD